MKRGYHWIGLLPDGRCALLYADPILKKTHTEIATFDTHIEAIRYCRLKRITLASTQKPPHAELRILQRDLPRNQQLVYDALLRRADQSGLAKATIGELLAETGIGDRAMLYAVLNTLYLKGAAARVESGWGDTPSTYLVKAKKPPSEEGGAKGKTI